jgi:type VI protein secretion system component VasF
MQNPQLSTVIEPTISTNVYTSVLKDSYFEDQSTASNQLINYGQPILLLCTKIIQGYSPNNNFELKITLANEIKIFTEKCKANNIPHATIAVAKYVLLSTIKDIFIDKDIEFDTTDHKHLLSAPFSELLLDLLKTPSENIELLELIFICYKFGFRDNYIIDHHIAFDHLDLIYHAIRKTTGNVSKNLFYSTKQISNTQNKIHVKKTFPKFFLFLGIVAFSCLLISNLLLIHHFILLNNQVTIGLNSLITDHQNGK